MLTRDWRSLSIRLLQRLMRNASQPGLEYISMVLFWCKVEVMIDRDRRGHLYLTVRSEILFFLKTEYCDSICQGCFRWSTTKVRILKTIDVVLVLTINHAHSSLEVVIYTTPSAPYEKSKSLGSGGSMVARLKLKGIDGRAPPGVEPAA